MDGKVREEARKAARDRGIHAALIADNDVLGAEQIGRAAANAAIDAYEAALEAAGYVMVPREATEAMELAAADATIGTHTDAISTYLTFGAKNIWSAMIEAATNPAP